MSKLNKITLRSFIISFVIVLSVLVAQFIWVYYQELSRDNISLMVVSKLIFYVALSMLSFVIPISVCVSAAVKYRLQYKETTVDLSLLLINGCKIGLFFSITTFLIASYIQPIASKHLLQKLYSIRNTGPEKPYEEKDITIFKDARQCQNIIQLHDSKKVATAKLDTLIRNFTAFAQRNDDVEFKRTFFSDSILKIINIPFDSIKTNNRTISTDGKIPRDVINIFFIDITYSIQNINLIKSQIAFIYKKTAQTFLLFYCGLFLGILNRRNKLVFLILGLMWVFLPLVYYIDKFIENSAYIYQNPLLTMVQSISFTIAITFVLYLLSRKSIKSTDTSVFDMPQ